MTETPQGQTYKWFDKSTDIANWMAVQFKEGYHPAILFKDPTDKNILVVMTTDDNRLDYNCLINHKVT